MRNERHRNVATCLSKSNHEIWRTSSLAIRDHPRASRPDLLSLGDGHYSSSRCVLVTFEVLMKLEIIDDWIWRAAAASRA
jgi:hypothetical protein